MSIPTFDYRPSPQATNPWEEALGLQGSRLGIINQVREGLPPTAFERFSDTTGLSREALAKLVHISTRTVSRRKERGERLDPATSERLVRLATLYARAGEIIGDTHLAQQWMQTPRETFGGTTPLLMAETELGAREVEDLLLRVEHGVFY